MNNDVECIVQRWWQCMFLSADELKKTGLYSAPTAHKAQLKRCDSIDAAMLTEGFRKLWFALPEDLTQAAKVSEIECWATIAAALVYVRSDSNTKLAEAAGSKAGGEKSVVSELRFAQLQDAKTPDDFLRRLRRILQQIKGDISVISLAKDIEQWFKEHNTLRPHKAEKRIAVQWAMDYYHAASKK